MTYETALQRTTAMCSMGEHCLHDIREKLVKWNLSTTEIQKILDYLVDEKFIDESRYCRAYVMDKLRYNHWGRIRIAQMLRMQRLDAHDIQQAMDQIPEDEYMDILQNVLTTKARSVKARSTYERNGKLIRFAIGRGFEMSLICKLLPEAEEMDQDCDGEYDE